METLIKKCQEAKHIMFITGAGISTASGLSTYRGIGGLYNKKTILPPELIMSRFVFKHIPSLVWKCLKENYKTNIEPNIAHYSIVLMEALTDRITVVTQNVDGLHAAAGSPDVIELHGNIKTLECTGCDYKDTTPDYSSLPKVPRCPKCKNVLRPPVVLFGETLPKEAVDKLNIATESIPDVVIAVGTTGSFGYIINALRSGKYTAVIDPILSSALAPYTNCWVKEKAEDALPYIVSRLKAC